MDLEGKIKRIREILSSLAPFAVAYSGGVDSTYLLKAAIDTQGNNVIALTALSPVVPGYEIRHARMAARILKAKHIIININCLDFEDFKSNTAGRCYICKKNMFLKFLLLKNSYGFKNLVDGTNSDDLNLWRPGLKAIRELGVRSPLAEAGFTKDDIVRHSMVMGLPGWNRPSGSCLATRIPRGEEITEAKLKVIGRAEEILKNLGFKEVRVRYHFPTARIEIPPDHMEKMLRSSTRDEAISKLKNLGFKYVVLDLAGYRKGIADEI